MRIVKWQGDDGLGLALRAEGGDGRIVLLPTHAAKRVASASLRAIGEDPKDYEMRVMAPWVTWQWKRVGDGTRLIDPNDRMPYLWRAFDVRHDAGMISLIRRSRGTLSLAETVGSRAVAWLPEEGSEADMSLDLTPGERELVGVARAYAELIAQDGLVDVGTVYKELPGRLSADGWAGRGIALTGFDQMGYVQQTLVSGLDRELSNVSLLVRSHECDIMEVHRSLRADGTWDVDHVAVPGGHGFHVTSRARHMLDDLKSLGTAMDEVPGCLGTETAGGDGHVGELVRGLFSQDASNSVPCRSLEPPTDGSVSLLHVAGVTAEDGAVADEAMARAASGDVAVIGSDAYRMWESLAPRLLSKRKASHGGDVPSLRVTAMVSVPLSSIRTVSVLLDAAKQIVTLSGMLSAKEREALGLSPAPSTRHLVSAEAAYRRHEDEPTTAGWFMDMSQDVLGDMSWWPPDEILDLMSEESVGVPVPVIARLRSKWARQRTLTAYSVLETIMDAERVGERMAALSRSVADGLMSDVLPLMQSYVRRTGNGVAGRGGSSVLAKSNRWLATSAMDILASATRSIDGPQPGDPDSVDRYFTCVRQLMSHSKVTGELSATRGEPGATDGATTVALVTMEDAEGLAPRSYDAVIMTGQDSVTSGVARDDGLQSTLMAKLGCAETSENMASYRAGFITAVSLARSAVVFERVLRKTEGRHVCETFPSVGLSNVMLAYKEGSEDSIPVRYVSETEFARNLSLTGSAPKETGRMPVSPIEECSEDRVALMWASRPRGGEGSQQVMLSASDVDAYAHCGYKWFVDRVLQVRSPVEDLPPYVYGSFAHAVMEEAHRDMIRDAAQTVVEEGGRRYPVTPYAQAMASGDRLDHRIGGDPDTMACPIPEGYTKGMPGTRVGGNGQVDQDAAVDAFRAKVREAYVAELSGAGVSGVVPMIPHTITEATKADVMAQSVERFPGYESHMFWKERDGKGPSYFAPRFVELRFGEEYGRPVTIAGMPFHGTIDRIDVNGEGECIILDYKNSSPDGFARNHRLSPYEDSNLQLIVYAEAVRQLMPDLRIVGLVYVSTRHPYAMSGKLDNAVFDATDAKGINLAMDSRLVPQEGSRKGPLPADAPRTMEEFIEMMVRKVEECVEGMSQGIHTSPEPSGAILPRQCSFCAARGRCAHS